MFNVANVEMLPFPNWVLVLDVGNIFTLATFIPSGNPRLNEKDVMATFTVIYP